MRENNKGSTLIEIVVTLLIVASFLIFIGVFFLNGGKYFQRAQMQNEDKLIGDSIVDLIENTVKFAGKIEIVAEDETAKYSNIISLKDNKLELENENITEDNIYSNSFYGDRKLSYIVSNINNTSIEIKINIINSKDEIVYTTMEVINFPNVSLAGNTIEMLQESITNPKISYEESKINIDEDSNGDYIPGTTVKVNSTWPDFEEFYDNNGYPKGVSFTKGETIKYDGKYYLIAQNINALYIGWDDPTPENALKLGWYDYVLIDISDGIVYDYSDYKDVWRSMDIKRGNIVLKDGKYYAYNASGFWGDVPPHNNYVELVYPLT